MIRLLLTLCLALPAHAGMLLIAKCDVHPILVEALVDEWARQELPHPQFANGIGPALYTFPHIDTATGDTLYISGMGDPAITREHVETLRTKYVKWVRVEYRDYGDFDGLERVEIVDEFGDATGVEPKR